MESKERPQAGYKVIGRVQGVGYRWWARQVATELGVCGTAENWPDGSVVVHATAPAEVLEAFAMQLEKGPWAASVDRVESVPSEGRLSTDRFEILL
ncbi:MAG: acylphosphatase [Longimicrobiales bacterium]